MKQYNVAHKLAAVVTTAVLMSEAGTALAQTTLGTIGTNITASTKTLPNMISSVAYIGGVGLGVAGVFKLKQHVDNPAQVAMKDGLVRLGAAWVRHHSLQPRSTTGWKHW